MLRGWRGDGTSFGDGQSGLPRDKKLAKYCRWQTLPWCPVVRKELAMTSFPAMIIFPYDYLVLILLGLGLLVIALVMKKKG
jgi:hypothetical protein